MTVHTDDFTIREARPADDTALRRLAALDGGRVPSGRLLVADAEGELVAAVPLAGGRPIADPFRHTAGIVSLLGLRAAQLRGLARRRKAGAQRPPRLVAVAGPAEERIPVSTLPRPMLT